VAELDRNLCGRSRPGHFQGVATVVCKLFNLVQPTFAAFGEKDWQQLAVIRKMTRELDIPVRIEGRPIIREADGLAMSSRNVYLTAEERAVAPHIQKGLCLLEDLVRTGEADAARLRGAVEDYYREHIPTGQLDYLELVDPVTIQTAEQVRSDVLAAVALRLGRARLIDNKYIPFEK
jgi:pantoate--beta-alanine ligase